MEGYACAALAEMFEALQASPDLEPVLAVLGDDPTVIKALAPSLLKLLVTGIDLVARAADGGVRLGAAEKDLQVAGREVMRLLLQSGVDLVSAREQRRHGGVLGTDGITRTYVERGHARDVATVFGRITVHRLAYRAPGAGNLHPLDEVLDLPAGLYSAGLAELCAIETARGSFATASAAVERATGVRIGTRQVIDLVRDGAQDAQAFYAGRARVVPQAGPQDAVVITADGKGVVVRPEGLREATAKKAAQGGGEGGNRKRMAEIVCVHDLAPVPRSVDDILPLRSIDPGHDGGADTVKGPVASGKWLTASLVEDIATVIGAGFDEAERRDPGHTRPWLGLVDGNTTQIEAITTEAASRGVEVTILIDYLHVSGYVWDAAKAFFCTDTVAGMALARAWVHDRNRMVLQGRALEVADRITARVRGSKLTAAQRKAALAAATYLTNKAPHLDYPAALAKGWPIATGVIEGACRHLVADRMDITGARWGLDTAQAVLTLRAIITTGDFNSYWTHHQQQEHDRNHATIKHHRDHTKAA